MSTPAERLQAIHDSFSKAYARRLKDWKDAKSQAEADAVSRNLNRLEETYLRAAKQALDANGAAVEAAYEDAKSAQKIVDEAYQEAKKLPERIRLVSGIATSIADLLRKAGKVAG